MYAHSLRAGIFQNPKFSSFVKLIDMFDYDVLGGLGLLLKLLLIILKILLQYVGGMFSGNDKTEKLKN
jgi:hypothetical protein